MCRGSQSEQVIEANYAQCEAPDDAMAACRPTTVANVSPKQPSARHLRDWYPYYAGFTERFVDAVIHDYLQGTRSVIDPWSGSGTTTVTCLRRGLESSGVDINPASTVIARARLNPTSARQRLLDIARSLVEKAHARASEHTDDLLGLWMVGDGVGQIRALVGAIRETVDATVGRPHAYDPLRTEGLSHLACFFYPLVSASSGVCWASTGRRIPRGSNAPRRRARGSVRGGTRCANGSCRRWRH